MKEAIKGNGKSKAQEINIAIKKWIIIATGLIVIGIIFTYSASSIYALEKHGCGHYYLIKECMGITIGILLLAACQLSTRDLLYKYTPLLFWLSCTMTALTTLTSSGITIHGSSRWLSIGSFSIQPSEILKIASILYLAYFIAQRTIKTMSTRQTLYYYTTTIVIPSILLLLQPDFGYTVVLIINALIMLFISHFTFKQVLKITALCVPAASILILSAPYRLKRITIFLNPWQDPQGKGYQIIQSLIAIGAGGLWGVGIGESQQKFFYLPMQHTDFIFSIIAEETGFMGCLLIITLFILFMYYGIAIATKCNDQFSSSYITGCTTIISSQAIINIAVTTGLVPTKGIGLPFISYGNSALITNLVMIGIAIRIARDQ